MQWASRRGLLELDLLLAPFMDECYAELSPSLKRDYATLMVEPDQDIMNWIMAREPVGDSALQDIVTAIRNHNRSLGGDA